MREGETNRERTIKGQCGSMAVKWGEQFQGIQGGELLDEKISQVQQSKLEIRPSLQHRKQCY